MKTILLKNATILTMNKQREILTQASLLVQGDKIIAIGKEQILLKTYTPTEIIDCTNKLIMPGLIDVHAHGGISLFKSVVKDTNEWMASLTHTFKHYVDDEFWFIESQLAALNRLKYGVTTGVSLLGTQPRCDAYSFALNQTNGYAKVGVRNFLATGPNAGPWPHRLSTYNKKERIQQEVSYEQALDGLEQITSKLHLANNGKTNILVAPYQVVTSIASGTEGDMLEHLTAMDKRNNKEMRRISKKYGTRIHTDAFRGMIKLAAEDDNALLGEDVHIQHCFGISMDEVKILAQTKTNVSFTPTFAQIKMHTPVIELMELGVNVAISSDGESYHSNFDMFEKMLLTQQMMRAIYNDRNYLPNEKIIEMLTIDAAKCLGMDKQIGSLEVGKKADLLVINLFQSHLTPAFDLPHLIVRQMHSSDIDMVFIDGECLVNNNIVAHLDENKLIIAAQEKAESIVTKAHLTAYAYPQKRFWGQTKSYYEKQRYDINWQREDGGYY